MCRGTAFPPSALTDWIVVCLTPSAAAVIAKDRTIDLRVFENMVLSRIWC